MFVEGPPPRNGTGGGGATLSATYFRDLFCQSGGQEIGTGVVPGSRLGTTRLVEVLDPFWSACIFRTCAHVRVVPPPPNIKKKGKVRVPIFRGGDSPPPPPRGGGAFVESLWAPVSWCPEALSPKPKP